MDGGQRIRALDGVRGLAALMVLVSHFANEAGFGRYLGNGTGQYAGVMLFFVLSGYLMGYLYRDLPFTLANVSSFFRRRFARIAPLFLVVLLANYCLALAGAKLSVTSGMSAKAFLATLTMWKGAGVFWTIPVEVQFYAVFPLLWWASQARPRLWFVWPAGAMVILMSLDGVKLPVLLDYGAAFFAGVLIAGIRSKFSVRDGNLIFVAALVAFVLLFPGIWRAFGITPVEIWTSALHLGVLSLFVFSVTHSPAAERLLANPIARWMGDISFSTYLLHLFVLNALKMTPIALNLPLYAGLFFAITLVISHVSHRYIETPARLWLSGSVNRQRVSAE
jgi:peptidoglycan/LPS O-acetylase OafA/YrhL